jgi:hypothetical protein
MEENLSKFPTISIRFKLPGLPCKYNTQNSELLICGTNIRCPKGFFDIGNQMCQPISDVRANGIAASSDGKKTLSDFKLPQVAVADMFILMMFVVVLVSVVISAFRLILDWIFNKVSRNSF